MVIQFLTGDFDPRTTCTGGSESCVIYLAEALTRLGHTVLVVNGKNFVHRRVLYTDTVSECDLIVSWRNYHMPNTGAKVKLLWCHDIPVPPHAPASFDKNCPYDAVVVLNPAHRAQYSAFIPEDKLEVIQIGVPKHFNDWKETRIDGKCVYCSHPHRGLTQLREMWPQIRREYPNATLHAFWWQPEFFLPADESIGIMPMRGVDDIELAQELQSAELLTYPSVFTPEISPAACIKAQIAGAVPVVVPASQGMRESLHYSINVTMEAFPGAVVKMLREKSDQEALRKQAKAVADYFDWDRVAIEWTILYYRYFVKNPR